MAYQTHTVTIVSKDDYENTKQGQYQYWREELRGSQYMLRRWHRQADRISRRYLDERTNQGSGLGTREYSRQPGFRLNLFYSNTQVLLSLLYGRVPRVDVKRRYNDSADDRARVAGVILERLLNNDMSDNPVMYDSVLSTTLEDRLVPGLGCVRLRYELETSQASVSVESEDASVTAIRPPRVESEEVPLEYVHWRDVLWSWCRTPHDLRWMAFRSFVTKDEAKKRYGESVAEDLTYAKHKQETNDESPTDHGNDDFWMKAEIWSIWCKETRRVYELSFGYDKILRVQDDPLELTGFFPAPSFFLANATSSLYKPTPDFHLTQDLYNEIDKLQTRIAIITEAVKVVGVYDASNEEVKRMFKEGVENELIPVSNWAMFAEKGGMSGAIDWFPIADVVAALLNLRQLRDETIELLYQVSGMADVMRGVLANQYEGVGQTQEKTMFGSVRVQKLQEDYARFVSEMMSIKAEIICRHFEPETIARLANVAAMPEEPELIAEAIGLLKRPEEARLKVSVKADSLAMADYARMQQERVTFLTGLSQYMAAAAPLLQQSPETGPYLLRMLQWGMTGFRGADEIEGILDKAIEAAEEAQKQPKGPPEEVQREQARAQGQVQLENTKHQNQMQFRQYDLQADVQTRQAEHKMAMAEKEADFVSQAKLIMLKGQNDIREMLVDAEANAEQAERTTEAEVNKDTINHQQKLDEMIASAQLKIRETRASTEGKLLEKMAEPPKQESDGEA